MASHVGVVGLLDVGYNTHPNCSCCKLRFVNCVTLMALAHHQLFNMCYNHLTKKSLTRMEVDVYCCYENCLLDRLNENRSTACLQIGLLSRLYRNFASRRPTYRPRPNVQFNATRHQ